MLLAFAFYYKYDLVLTFLSKKESKSMWRPHTKLVNQALGPPCFTSKERESQEATEGNGRWLYTDSEMTGLWSSGLLGGRAGHQSLGPFTSDLMQGREPALGQKSFMDCLAKTLHLVKLGSKMQKKKNSKYTTLQPPSPQLSSKATRSFLSIYIGGHYTLFHCEEKATSFIAEPPCTPGRHMGSSSSHALLISPS